MKIDGRAVGNTHNCGAEPRPFPLLAIWILVRRGRSVSHSPFRPCLYTRSLGPACRLPCTASKHMKAASSFHSALSEALCWGLSLVLNLEESFSWISTSSLCGLEPSEAQCNSPAQDHGAQGAAGLIPFAWICTLTSLVWCFCPAGSDPVCLRSCGVLQNLCQGFPANLKDVMSPLLVPGNSSKAELG